MIKSLNRWKFIKYTLAVFNLLASMSSIIGLFYTIYEKSINNKTAWIWHCMFYCCINCFGFINAFRKI